MDDHFHRALGGATDALPGLTPRPFDLFVFASGDRTENQALMDAGVFPWWSDPEVKLAFFRPIASALHQLDYALFKDSAALMHLHSLLWFALGLFLLFRLYRRVIAPRFLAVLAFALYALDDARGPVVGWIANRNALIALAFGTGALLLFDRAHRSDDRDGPEERAAPPAPVMVAGATVCFALSLLSGEAGLAMAAYLASHALHMQSGEMKRRLMTLAPFVAVVVLWRLLYSALGYGVTGSGVYADPVHSPLDFAQQVLVHGPFLLVSQFLGPWADAGALLPFLSRGAAILLTLMYAGLFALFAFTARPVLRASHAARFWFTGALLAAVPVCSTFPADRLLSFVAIGGAGFLAEYLNYYLAKVKRESIGRSLRVLGPISAASLFVVHILISPAALALRARSMVSVAESQARIDRGIPADATDKTVIVVNSPGDAFLGFTLVRRHGLGQPHPSRLRWLAPGLRSCTLKRVDAQTLELEPEGGYLKWPMDRMLTSAAHRFTEGEEIAIEGLTLTVLQATDDGRPAQVRARFDRPLENHNLLFLQLTAQGLVPFKPPAVGETQTLPGTSIWELLAPPADAIAAPTPAPARGA